MRRCAIWLPALLIARLDRYAERLQRERPDVAIARADALRSLVEEGLGRHRVGLDSGTGRRRNSARKA